ncbi:hypothetical protein GF385_02145 [Candidatus Dependentiae bacterium]|nr:hypothetical protein [Candidatus Dependentiae bacterium]
MKRVIKMLLKRFLFILLVATPILNAGRGGSAFGGSFLGSMMGTTLGSAMTRRDSKTIVVKESGKVTRDEMIRLEQAIRSDFKRLEDRIRENEDRYRDQIRDLEDQIADLKRQIPSK